MKPLLLFTVSILLTCAACTREAKPPQSGPVTPTAAAEHAIDGSWVSRELVIAGEKIDSSEGRAAFVTIQGRRARFEGIDGVVQTGELQFRLDRRPQGLEFVIEEPAAEAGTVVRLLFDVAGDTATFVRRMDGEWPDDLNVAPGANEIKVIYERVVSRQ